MDEPPLALGELDRDLEYDRERLYRRDEEVSGDEDEEEDVESAPR